MINKIETYISGTVAISEIENIDGELVFPEKVSQNLKGYLIWMDLEPGANWAHNCVYVFLTEGGGEVFQVKQEWPPSEKIELTLIKSPF